MAREQVRELATRGVRPSSIQAGTTPVVVQQAAEPAVMGLARGLAGVNKALGHYTNVVEHASASEEARIRSMTAEERKAELEKMEANFDKMERKGQIPFLSNPVSWKRKSRALGVGLANDLYNQMDSDTGRLKNPEEGDENLTLDEIMGQEIGQFFEDNPQLYNQPTVIDEFHRAFDVKRNAIQSQYGDRQATQIKNGIIRERTTQIYDLYKDLVLGDEIIAKQTMQEAWGEMGFLTAKQQLDVIANIAKSLADNDPEAVEDFLEDAKSLKVGNTTFGKNTKAVDDIDTIIADRLEDNEEKDRKKKNRDRIEQDAADDASYEKAKYEFHSFASQISSKGSVEYEGESYTSLAAFREAYLDKMASDYMDTNRALHGRIAQYVGEEWSPITRDDTANTYILQQADGQLIDTLRNGRTQDLIESSKKEIQELGDLLPSDAEAAAAEMVALQEKLIIDLAGIYKTLPEQDSIKGLPTNEKIKEISRQYKEQSDRKFEQFKESVKAIKARKEKANQNKKEADAQLKQEKDAGKVVSTKGVFGRTLPPLETIDRLTHNLALLTEKHPDAKKENAVAEIKRGEDLDLYVRIANGTVPKKEAGYLTELGIEPTPAIPYSDEERKQALDYVILRKAMAGEFTNLEVLRQQRISKIGAPFDPSKLNPNIHYILTEKEIESGADDPVVIEKAGIIGYNPEDLVEAQKETYKKIPNLF